MQVMEQEFEDWICDNIDQVVPGGLFLGRQVKLPTGGVLDVLAGRWRPWKDVGPDDPRYAWGVQQIWVIEIKRDEVGPDAVSQILGYMAEVQSSIDFVTEDQDPSQRLHYEVRGVLCGQRIATAAATAMRQARIDFVRLHARISAERWCGVTIRQLDTESGADARRRVGDFVLFHENILVSPPAAVPLNGGGDGL